MPQIDAKLVKQQAAGHWVQILQSVGGLTAQQVDFRINQPCPKCGGKDRFRAFNDVAETGGVMCNQCHNTRNGDGFATLQWLLGCTFAESARLTADWLNIGNVSRAPVTSPQARSSKPSAHVKGHPTWSDAVKAISDAWPDAVHLYETAPGKPHMVVCRWGTGPTKRIRPVSLRGNQWVPLATEGTRTLYRLPELANASTVYVVEGEKPADALADQLEIVATTSPNGASAVAKTDWTPLDGKNVVLMPDNDKAGNEYCDRVIAQLERAAPNATIQICRIQHDWPELPEKGDAFDWLEQFDTAEPAELLQRIKAVTKHHSGLRKTRLSVAEIEAIDRIGQPSSKLISTGIEALDSAVGGGFQAGEMVVLAARPSHGKSLVAMQMLQHQRRCGNDSLMLSEEMTAPMLADRSLLHHLKTPQPEWQDRRDEIREQWSQRVQSMGEIHIVESCQRVQVIEEQIRHHVDAHDVQVVAVDYLQLLTSGESRKYEDVSKVSAALARVAKELQIVLIGLCQMNRSIEGRNAFTPRMSDLRESGQIEQDADVILFFVHPHKLDPTREKGEYWAYLAKNRNREMVSPVTQLMIEPERQRVVSPAPAWMETAQNAFT